MNDAVDSANLTGIFTSLASSFDPESSPDREVNPLQHSEFIDIISDQELLSGFLLQLKKLLPDGEFAPIATLLESGNGLPLTAEVAGELPATLNPQVVQALLAGLGLSSGPAGRSDSVGHPNLSGDGSAIVLNSEGISRVGVAQRFGDVIIAPSDRGLEVAADSAIKGSGPVLDLTFNSLPIKPGLDIMPAELQTPLAELLPKSVWSIPTGDELGASPAAQLNMISGVPGNMSPEAATAPRAFGQVALELDVPLGKGSWEQGLGERVLWLVGRSIQGASLRINPPQLGPIDIQLTLQNDQASVSFGAQHGAVREVLEAAIPRLREMFGENNLQLVNVDVGQRGSGDARPHPENANRDPNAGNGALAEFQEQEGGLGEGSTAGDSVLYYRSNSLLDDYA